MGQLFLTLIFIIIGLFPIIPPPVFVLGISFLILALFLLLSTIIALSLPLLFPVLVLIRILAEFSPIVSELFMPH